MKELLLIKEKIKKFVGKNDALIIPLLKFLLVFAAMLQINSKIGFMTKIASSPIALIIALAGSFLPLNLTLVILALIVTAHTYALSLECAAVVLAAFLVLFLLYFRFASKDSVAALLMPLSFVFKVPYVIPISMGLVGTPSSMVSTGCGVVVYYMIHFISENSASLSGTDTSSKIGAVKDIVDGLIMNKDMIVMAAACAATVLVVYIIRRLSIDYSWFIAIAAGVLTCLFAIIAGNRALSGSVSVGGAFVGLIISVIINIILQFFCFNLDYNRTEKVQFEDDEYYYYVKAVPKNTVKIPNKKKAVKKESPSVNKAGVQSQTRVVAKPQASSGNDSPVRTQARTTVRQNATKAASGSQKSFLGLSGGRPAGEGRLKEEAKARSLDK